MSHRRAKAIRQLMNSYRPEEYRTPENKVHKLPRQYKWYTTGTREVMIDGQIYQAEVGSIRNDTSSPRALYQKAKYYARPVRRRFYQA